MQCCLHAMLADFNSTKGQGLLLLWVSLDSLLLAALCMHVCMADCSGPTQSGACIELLLFVIVFVKQAGLQQVFELSMHVALGIGLAVCSMQCALRESLLLFENVIQPACTSMFELHYALGTGLAFCSAH
jgi:hypothetical protein